MNRKRVIGIVIALVVLGIAWSFLFPTEIAQVNDEEYTTPKMDITDPNHPDFDRIENGVHLRTGLAEGEGLQLVINHCTSCHSAKLVTQNRMSKERWIATIRWMQETQNLWDLGTNEEAIVEYLATHYAPRAKGRRQNLNDIEWYNLVDE